MSTGRTTSGHGAALRSAAGEGTPAALPRDRRLVLGLAAALVAATCVAYRHTFHGPFLLDDTFAIVDNPSIRHLGDLRQVLLPAGGYGVTVSGRPVLNLSLALCYAISGTNVWSYHALNLLIHALAGLTLFGLVRRTILLLRRADAPANVARLARRAPDATFLGFAVGLLWTLHPLQTEAVTYIIQRSESLLGLFFLLTFYAFSRSITSPHPARWRIATVLACLAAVGTKEIAATLPPLVLLYDRTFVAGTFRAAWRQRRGLLLALAATWLPLALLVASTGWNRGGTAGFDVGVSAWAYWRSQFQAITHYLQLSFWPHPLVFEYGKRWPTLAQAAPYALVVVALVAVTVVALRRRPVVGFLGAWFFVILAPTSLVPGTLQMIVEHRMYLPLAAVLTGAVLGLDALVRQWLGRDATSAATTPADPDGGGPYRRRSIMVLVPCLVAAAALGAVTDARNRLYADDLALWQQTVADSPRSALAQGCLGTALFQRHRIRDAIPPYRKAVELDPHDAGAHYNLALALATDGQLDAALPYYAEAVRLNPQFEPAYDQLGLALLQLGRAAEALPQLAEAARLSPTRADARYEWGVALARTGQFEAAVAQYRQALALDPDLTAAQGELGSALLALHRPADAAPCFERVVQAQPASADAHFNLGLARAQLGEAERAIAEYTAAVRLDPTLAKAQYNLGLALGQRGDSDGALAHLQRAVELAPAFAEGHGNLAIALMQKGRLREAVAEFEAALQRRPEYVAAHYGLAIALLRRGDVASARPHLEAALRLAPNFAPARAALERLNATAPTP